MEYIYTIIAFYSYQGETDVWVVYAILDEDRAKEVLEELSFNEKDDHTSFFLQKVEIKE